MKKIFFLILIFTCNVVIAQSEQPRTIVFKLLDMSAKPIANSSIPKSNNATFNNFLQEFSVEKYEQLCPYSKNTDLLKYYYIITCVKTDVIGALKAMTKTVSDIDEKKAPISTHVPTDYMYTLTNQNPNTDSWLWHLKKIDAEKAWDITKGEGTKVAVIDTWFDVNHPDLKTKFIYDYDPKTKEKFNNTSKIANPKLSHGTETSSCVGAQTDGGGQLASIGFNTKIIGYEWTNGVNKAHHASLVENADVISISWYDSYTKPSEYIISEIKEMLDNGTIIVAAAGNYLCDNKPNIPIYPFSPLIDDRIICVTSTDYQDRHQYFDSDGSEKTHAHYPSVTICAPGYNIMVAMPTITADGTENEWPYYGFAKGTSSAAPIVAGVCALMKSVNPKLTPKDAKKILMQTADPVADAAKFPNGVGSGRVNAYKAVKAAGTRNFTNSTLSGNRNLSAGYGFNLKNAKIGTNSNIKLTARCEVNIDGTFEVPLGSEFSIEIEENARSN